MTKLLVGVDGSEGSLAAVDLAGRLLKPNDELVIYYSPVDVPLRSEANNEKIIARARQALGEAVFAEARARLPKTFQGPVQTILGTQRASRELPAAAVEALADLVCVGSRGLGPIKSLLLGSVASAAVQTLSIPVLVARPKREPGRTGLNVVLAYDQSNSALQAAAVERLAWPAGSQGKLVGVIEGMPAPLPSWVEQRARSADAEAIAQAWIHEHQEDKQEFEQQLAKFNQTLPAIFRDQPPVVAEGHPAEQILELAQQMPADLIVVGKTSRSLYQRVLLGSTSRVVLQQATCSVLVVPLGESAS